MTRFLIGLALTVPTLFLTGCETPQDTAVLGAALSGVAPYGKDPRAAASTAAMGQAASGYGQAQAGRSQYTIVSASPNPNADAPNPNRARPKASYAGVIYHNYPPGLNPPRDTVGDFNVLNDRFVLANDIAIWLVFPFADVLDIRVDDSDHSQQAILIQTRVHTFSLDFGQGRDRSQVVSQLWEDLKSAGYGKIESR